MFLVPEREFQAANRVYGTFSKIQLQKRPQSDTLGANLPTMITTHIRRALASLLLALMLATHVSLAMAMETIFVSANKPAGRYDGPIYVRLTASDAEAKIWYTCKRNGHPGDLLRYETPILLTKSCALIYFAYVTTELESKIERTDYTILYSDDVKLETHDRELSLRNTGTDTVDIGGWEVIAGTGAITVPAGTTLLPSASYVIGSNVDPASYELKSPEGYTKSQLEVVAPPVIVEKPKPVAKAPVKAAENPKPATTDTPANPAPTQPIENTGTAVIPPAEIIAPATSSVTPPSSTSQPLNDIKASAGESNSNSRTAAIVAVLIVVVLMGVAKSVRGRQE